MKKRISTKTTFAIKFFTPLLWFLAVGLYYFHGPVEGNEKKILLLFWFLSFPSLLWICMRIKRVEIEEGRLIISDYFLTIQVPLADIVSVSENYFILGHPVWIRMRNWTKFGQKILFLPRIRFKLFRKHPTVLDLKELAGI
ncbi:hypothetical protein BVY01_04810 [bacterium I07]|nr:hypothetical protein BVY01_04810 [bacterium I07]